MPRSINIRQVEVFKAIIDRGSISQAASFLHVSQPSVSKTLKQLEDQLGVELFVRTPRGLVATDVARAFYAEVARAYVSFASLNQYAAGLKELRHGRVIVSSISALAFDWLPAAIDAFLADYPHASITISAHDSRITWQLVSAGMLDIGIAQFVGMDKSLPSQKICDIDTFLVVPAGHRLAGRKSVKPEDLADERWVLLSPDDPIRRQLESVMHTRGVGIKCFLDVSQGATVCALVEKGHGIGLVDSATVHTQDFRSIVPIRFTPDIKMPLYMFFSHASSSSILVRRLSEYIIAQGKKTDFLYRGR